MKTIQIDKFSGVRNDVTIERMKPGDLSRGLDIELDETGKPQLRLGVSEIDDVPTHSLWVDEDHCFCVRSGTLHRIMPDLTISDLGLQIQGQRVVYRRINNDTYFTDGVITGAYGLTGLRAWGSSRITANNERLSPPPPGRVLGHFNGRLFIGQDNYLWYTQPYDYEHVNRAVNFLGFSSPVTVFAPVSDGVFVGTEEEISFLKGGDPKSFVRIPKAPYGGVLGTETELPGIYLGGEQKQPQPIQAWMSKQGLCVGLDGGDFVNLTGERYLLPEGVATGASLFKLRGGSPHIVTTLFS